MAKKDDYLFENIHVYSIDEKNRNLYVHAEPEAEESGVDFRMATKLIKNLIHLDSISNEPINIHFISYGGCWNYGMAMYDTIKNCKSPTTCISYAHARSMSSIIPQSATFRHIHKHADFMVHYGTYGDSGDFRQVINGVKHYEKANKIMIDIYTSKCINGPFFQEQKMTYDEVYNFIKGKMDSLVDWWMTAEEAVYYGFMDKVI